MIKIFLILFAASSPLIITLGFASGWNGAWVIASLLSLILCLIEGWIIS